MQKLLTEECLGISDCKSIEPDSKMSSCSMPEGVFLRTKGIPEIRVRVNSSMSLYFSNRKKKINK